MMTEKQVIEIAEEIIEELKIEAIILSKYTVGKHTKKHNELLKKINSDECKCFKCKECGEMFGYFDIQFPIIEGREHTCTNCYKKIKIRG